MTVSTNEGSVQNFHKKKRQRAGDAVKAPNRYTNDDGRSTNTYGMRPLASIFSSVANNNAKNKPKEQKALTIDCVTIDDSNDSTSEEEKSENNSSSQPPPSQSYFPNPRLSRLSRAAGGGGGGLVLLSGNRENGCRASHRPPPIPPYLTSANASGVCNELSAAKDWGSGRIVPIATDEEEEELWIDKYAPRKMDELVVHRKKVVI